jgi:stage V sporulation protein G
MKVTEVNVRKMFDEGVLKAIVSVTFDDCFAVHDIKVVDTGTKKMVVMPSVKTADGRFRDTVHPMTSEFRKHIAEEVYAAVDVARAASAVEDT